MPSGLSGEPVQIGVDVEFDEMITRAESIQLDERPVRVVTKADLIATKVRAASDPAHRRSKMIQDQTDIGLLCGEPDDEGW